MSGRHYIEEIQKLMPHTTVLGMEKIAANGNKIADTKIHCRLVIGSIAKSYMRKGHQI
jgi:hypothetical protein